MIEPGAGSRGTVLEAGPILIVEDDFSIRQTLAQVLMSEGLDVVCAADGREALSVLADGHLRPRLIILDLWMPRLSGLEFRSVQQGYARWAEIPVLVITASRFPLRELEPLGLTHVLRKPLDLGALMAEIDALTAPV